MQRPFRCTLETCGHLCPSLRDLVSHTKRAHSLTRNLAFVCPIRGCSWMIGSAESFRKHASFRHRAEYLRGRSSLSNVRSQNLAIRAHCAPAAEPLWEEFPTVEGERENAVCRFPTVDNIPARPTCTQVYETLMQSVQKEATLLRLKLEHNFSLPTGVANGIYNECVQFAVGIQKRMSEVVSLRLQDLGVDDEDTQHYLDCPELEKICNSTDGTNLSTLKALGYIEAKPLDLYELAGEEPPANHTNKSVMHYVPILETLKSYLSHEDVVTCILREPFSSEHLCSFTSGTIFREHPLFSVEKNALRIHLYTDELEICNPLGGNTKKHKLCCIYFQVGNIGPKNLSSLQSIHLVALVKWPLVVKFGYKTILKPLLADLNILSEDGIDVKVKSGGTLHFRGAAAVFVGDNASMHALGGFRKCFSSGKVCRFCLADYGNLNQLREESQCNMRTPELHSWHMQMVERDSTLSPVYGVLGTSSLSGLAFFQNPYCLPPDIMHDLLEKVLPLNIKSVLRGLSKMRVLPYPRAQDIHSRFVFCGVDTINKHPGLPDNLLAPKYQVKGSASQKLHLFHFLSLILGPHVPEDNKFWKLHLLVNRILDIVMAPIVSRDMVIELAGVVSEHHKLWVKLVQGCYPPKVHYLLHYARYMTMHGPLRHMWSMRFESFHQILKNFANKSRNYRNVTYTLSKRVQMKKCLELSCDEALVPCIQMKSTQRTVPFCDVPDVVRDCVSEICIGRVPETMVRVHSLNLNGLLIRYDCYNVLNVIDGDPVFLMVKEIYCYNFKVFVLGITVASKCFNDHLHAFEIVCDAPDNAICVEGSQLLSGQTLQAYTVGDKLYIKLKFTPVE